jgi:Zn-finger nucleic acid-binding protein
MWLDRGELDQLIHLSEQPGMIRRVVKDVMATLRRKPGEAEGKT